MEDKALDKIDIASELKTLSPIEKKSLELKKQADEAEITDKVTYVNAKKIKKALVSHRTSTKDLRLTFTRKLDNLKDQFIKKQDEVLEASLAGEEIIKEKVAAWEKLEQERKDAEEKRVRAILDKFKSMTPPDMKTGTPEDVKRFRAAVKMERGLLDIKDRNKVAVKTLLDDIETEVEAIEGFILERLEQEEIAKQQKEEQERLDAARKQLEADQEAAQKREEAARGVQSEKIDKQINTMLDDTPEGIEALRNGDIVQPVISGKSLTQEIQDKLDGKESSVHQIEWRFESSEELTEEELLKVGAQIVGGSTGGFVSREL